eukprot:PhF_6_TR6187/c2_g2_i1/m.9281
MIPHHVYFPTAPPQPAQKVMSPGGTMYIAGPPPSHTTTVFTTTPTATTANGTGGGMSLLPLSSTGAGYFPTPTVTHQSLGPTTTTYVAYPQQTLPQQTQSLMLVSPIVYVQPSPTPSPMVLTIPMNPSQHTPISSSGTTTATTTTTHLVSMPSTPSSTQIQPAHQTMTGGSTPCDNQSLPNAGLPWRPVYKTKMCRGFLSGSCRYGERCMFAHGDKDLIEIGDSVRPTSTLTEEQRAAEESLNRQLLQEQTKRK